MSGALGSGTKLKKTGIPVNLDAVGMHKKTNRTFTLPSGIKRKADATIYASSESDTSEDEDYAPPPRKRAEASGLRAAPRPAPEPYWDHANHIAACRAEQQSMAGEAGVSLDDLDEGGSIHSSDEDEESSEEGSEDNASAVAEDASCDEEGEQEGDEK